MSFATGQSLLLPEVAEKVGLHSAEFRVEQVVKGGMGECIRVVQGNSRFALKFIRREISENDDAWQRYLREIRLWTTLSACDGVVEALCLTHVNEIPVVCSRWMQGGNLRTHLTNRTPEIFFSVLARIVGTLRWTYEQHKIIHRDLKPDNILLDEVGQAYVSDWGLARPLATPDLVSDQSQEFTMGQTHPALTADGSFLGTICYAAPEQLLGAPDLDHRADIYSLGCLMYEWESGHCPLLATSAQEIRLKHLFEAPRPLGGFLKKTAFGAEAVIDACLKKEPHGRPGDYASLDALLKQAALARGVEYRSFRPKLRYQMPMVGAGEYRHYNRGKGKPGTYHVIEHEQIEPFLREAEALMNVGDYRKAAEIYGSLFVPKMVTAVPDYPHNQHVTVNYGNCLIALGRVDEAIAALHCLSGAKEKPAGYFVNLSLGQIRQSEYSAAVRTATEGLRFYPGDHDLLGNLLTAQTALGDFPAAAETAKVRLTQKRDVHSLHEVALLHCKYGDTIRDLDWPLAVNNFKYAVGLLREAKNLNPRYLEARIQLVIVLEMMTAYSHCSNELAAAKDLPFHFSDRIFLAYLFARCLDRVNDHKGCWEFCDKWLKWVADNDPPNKAPRYHVVRLERVRALTIADGYCIGKMKNGQRVIAPVAVEFFARIIHDEELREAGDFCYLARLHEWLGEYDKAYDALVKGESLYPNYWEIPFQRAAFRVRSGTYREAIISAEKATQLAPWKTQTWELLAEIHTRLENAAAAEAARKRAEEVQRVRDQLNEQIEGV